MVSQCRSIIEHADATLAGVLRKLNAATNLATISGSGGTNSGQLVEMLRTCAATLLGVTAASQVRAHPKTLTLTRWLTLTRCPHLRLTPCRHLRCD